MARLLSLLLLLNVVSLASALSIESSANLNALCGTTILSESVTDLAFSPLIGQSGIAFSLVNNFGNSSANIYSLASSDEIGILSFGAGFSIQSADSYRWQDQYLSAALIADGFGIGYTQHLSYLNTGESEGEYEWSSDFAVNAVFEQYGSEIRITRMNSDERELHLTVLTQINPYCSVSSAYIWKKGDQGRYVAASVYDLAPGFQVQSSWQSNPARFGFGLSAEFSTIKIGYAVRTHSELDLTHCLDISYAW